MQSELPTKNTNTARYVESEPHPWPYDGDLRPSITTVIVIDMQTDFSGKGGYVGAMGYDLPLPRRPSGRSSAFFRRHAQSRSKFFIRAKVIDLIFLIFRLTSSGAAGASEPAS